MSFNGIFLLFFVTDYGDKREDDESTGLHSSAADGTEEGKGRGWEGQRRQRIDASAGQVNGGRRWQNSISRSRKRNFHDSNDGEGGWK